MVSEMFERDAITIWLASTVKANKTVFAIAGFDPNMIGIIGLADNQILSTTATDKIITVNSAQCFISRASDKLVLGGDSRTAYGDVLRASQITQSSRNYHYNMLNICDVAQPSVRPSFTRKGNINAVVITTEI